MPVAPKKSVSPAASPQPAQLAGPNRMYLGIDPGASGGLACVTGDGVAFKSMPPTEQGVWDWIKLRVEQGSRNYNGVRCCIEQVSGYIGEAHPGSSMFNFGASYGGLRMALVACGVRFEAVRPQLWQKALGIPHRKKSEDKRQWKQRLLSEAKRLFTDLLPTLATADALLLAYYCRLKDQGN